MGFGISMCLIFAVGFPISTFKGHFHGWNARLREGVKGGKGRGWDGERGKRSG